MEFTGIIMFPIILKQLAWEKLEWPFADSVTVWATWQYPLQARTWFSRRQHPKYGAAFPKTRITNPRIKKWTRKGHHSLAPLVTHWQKFCFLSQDYMFCWPESLNFKGEKKVSTRRHKNDSTEREFKTITWPLWSPQVSESVRTEEVTTLAGATDPDCQRETGPLLHDGGKEEHLGNTGDPLGCLLILQCTGIKFNRKLKQSNSSGTLLMSQTL